MFSVLKKDNIHMYIVFTFVWPQKTKIFLFNNHDGDIRSFHHFMAYTAKDHFLQIINASGSHDNSLIFATVCEFYNSFVGHASSNRME